MESRGLSPANVRESLTFYGSDPPNTWGLHIVCLGETIQLDEDEAGVLFSGQDVTFVIAMLMSLNGREYGLLKLISSPSPKHRQKPKALLTIRRETITPLRGNT